MASFGPIFTKAPTTGSSFGSILRSLKKVLSRRVSEDLTAEEVFKIYDESRIQCFYPPIPGETPEEQLEMVRSLLDHLVKEDEILTNPSYTEPNNLRYTSKDNPFDPNWDVEDNYPDHITDDDRKLIALIDAYVEAKGGPTDLSIPDPLVYPVREIDETHLNALIEESGHPLKNDVVNRFLDFSLIKTINGDETRFHRTFVTPDSVLEGEIDDKISKFHENVDRVGKPMQHSDMGLAPYLEDVSYTLDEALQEKDFPSGEDAEDDGEDEDMDQKEVESNLDDEDDPLPTIEEIGKSLEDGVRRFKEAMDKHEKARKDQFENLDVESIIMLTLQDNPGINLTDLLPKVFKDRDLSYFAPTELLIDRLSKLRSENMVVREWKDRQFKYYVRDRD